MGGYFYRPIATAFKNGDFRAVNLANALHLSKFTSRRRPSFPDTIPGEPCWRLMVYNNHISRRDTAEAANDGKSDAAVTGDTAAN